MRWIIKPQSNPHTTKTLAVALGVDTTIADLLVKRGIESFDQAKSFFRPNLSDLHNPYLMKDMDKAVARVEIAIDNQENILIFGDYDVDGTTAVSLLYNYIKTKYQQVATYIPDRYAEGYGISYQGIDFACDNNFSLIIALDCGIKAVEKVAYASQKGIDFIICDHHRPGNEIPKAVAVLDPKREDCAYPYKELCGCGVGFKLIQALAQKDGISTEQLIPYLDLVATAIAADIVPITGENRILAYYGLQVINSAPRPGIGAMIHQLKKDELTITDVVFIIAPRINAAGRIKHGNAAVELLTEIDFDTAVAFAAEIEQFNSERKDLDKSITIEALQQIEQNKEQQNYTSVVFNDNWHKGVIGIVASRLTETYYRPTLVFTKSGDKLAASARSVKGFDIYEALEKCEAYIEQFGGHKYAAGLTLAAENYAQFKNAFEKVVKASILEEQRSPELLIDAEISLSEITPKFYRILKQFAPFGPGNMRPVFSTSGLRDTGYGRKVGTDEDHIKLNVFDGANQKTISAIGFNLGAKMDIIESAQTFKAAYNLDENQWNGTTTLQLILKDIEED